MKSKVLLTICVCILFTMVIGCQKEYKGEYIRWGEKTNSNATELLKENGIPYQIKEGIIYIPEDAFDKSILFATKDEVLISMFVPHNQMVWRDCNQEYRGGHMESKLIIIRGNSRVGKQQRRKVCNII